MLCKVASNFFGFLRISLSLWQQPGGALGFLEVTTGRTCNASFPPGTVHSVRHDIIDYTVAVLIRMSSVYQAVPAETSPMFQSHPLGWSPPRIYGFGTKIDCDELPSSIFGSQRSVLKEIIHTWHFSVSKAQVARRSCMRHGKSHGYVTTCMVNHLPGSPLFGWWGEGPLTYKNTIIYPVRNRASREEGVHFKH